MFDVLMFIFESIVFKNKSHQPADDNLLRALIEADFDQDTIEAALEWYAGLSQFSNLEISNSPGWNRVFSHTERAALGVAGCNYLLSMHKLGVLDAVSFEIVVDRLLALQAGSLKLVHIKWVALVVLFHRGKQDSALKWLEQGMLEEQEEAVH